MVKDVKDLVNEFYEKKVWNQKIGTSLFEELRGILSLDQKVDVYTHIIDDISEVGPKNNFPQNKIESLKRSLGQWNRREYSTTREGPIKRIERKSIINLAFALSLDNEQCNQILSLVNHLPLHYGGDATESIISYSLKEHKSIERAKQLFDCYTNLVESVSTSGIDEKNYLNECDTFVCGITNNDGKAKEKSQHNYTNRTEFVRNIINYINLTPSSRFKKINSSLEKKLNVILENSDFSEEEKEFLKRLWATSKMFSLISNKVFSHIRFLIRENSITVNEFKTFYGIGGPDAGLIANDPRAIDNIFVFCRKNYAGKDVPKITRTFFILLCVLVWVKASPDENMRHFIDNQLAKCGYRLLNQKYSDDALIIELSKYRIEHEKEYTLNYITPENNHHRIKYIYPKKSTTEVYNEILQLYLEMPNNALCDCNLQISKQFFEFDN